MALSNTAQWMERGMTTASCGLIAGVVAVADERVKERLLRLLSGDVTSEVGAINTQLRRAAMFATHSGGTEEMTLVLFVVAAIVLFGFMLFV
jgi:hypothetical protein